MRRAVRRTRKIVVGAAMFAVAAGCARGGGGGGVSGGERDPDWTFSNGADAPTRVAISADGTRVLAGGGERVSFLATDTLSPVWEWTSTMEYEWIDSVALSRDGSRGVASGEGIFVFEPGGPTWWTDILWLPGGGYTDAIGPMAIGEDGASIVAAGAYVTRYAGATGTVEWVAQPLSANLIAISRDANTIAAELAGPGIALFDGGSATPLWVSSENFLRDDIVVSADGSGIAVSGEGGVTFYARSSPEPVWVWPSPNGMDVTAVAMPADGASVVAGGAGFVTRIAVATGKSDWTYEASLGSVYDVAVSADGERIAAGSDWGVVTSLSGKGTVRWSYAAESDPMSVALSDDGAVLVAGTWGSVHVFVE